MKVITKEYQVYQFNELKKEAQYKALNELVKFYLEAIPYEDMPVDMQRAINRAEELQTPWFAGEYIRDYCLKYLTRQLVQYQYLDNGEIFS